MCGPFPELRISPPAQMIYLFVTSIVPTVPGAWLTFADGAVYSVYDIPARLWGISVTSDQQVAGVLMKLVGGSYLWVLITVIFFRWAGREYTDQAPAAASTPVPSARSSAPADRSPPAASNSGAKGDRNASFRTELRGEWCAGRRRRSDGRAVGRRFERRDVELLHAEHRLHGAVGAGRVGVVEEGLPALRHDLPGEAELVLQPTALALLAAVGGEGVPVVVDLGLVSAADLEARRLRRR